MVKPPFDPRSRRECIMLDAVNPIDGKTCQVQINFERMQAVGRRSFGHAKECGYLVPMILQNPTAVFEGLLRDEDDDRREPGWRCYCGIPDVSYRLDGSEAPPYPGQVFLVFVNCENVGYNWRWEKSDRDDASLPDGYAHRFRKRLQ